MKARLTKKIVKAFYHYTWALQTLGRGDLEKLSRKDYIFKLRYNATQIEEALRRYECR